MTIFSRRFNSRGHNYISFALLSKIETTIGQASEMWKAKKMYSSAILRGKLLTLLSSGKKIMPIFSNSRLLIARNRIGEGVGIFSAFSFQDGGNDRTSWSSIDRPGRRRGVEGLRPTPGVRVADQYLAAAAHSLLVTIDLSVPLPFCSLSLSLSLSLFFFAISAAAIYSRLFRNSNPIPVTT